MARVQKLRSQDRSRRTGEVSTSESSVAQQEKAECEVCNKLLKRLKDPLVKGNVVELGDWDEIVLSSTCEFHPPLMISSFYMPLRPNSTTTISALRSRARGHFVVFEGAGSDNDLYCNSSELRLLGKDTSESESNQARGRLVDPEWINPGLVRSWKRSCDRLHDDRCTCLVPAPKDKSYVALSYVWGRVSSFRTLKENLKGLQQHHALTSAALEADIPRTIKDAIAFTSTLEERYLWVDSLCIVQDDELEKESEIANMASIYAEATLTIVACGENANQGLRGLYGIAEPRNFAQSVFKLSGSTEKILTPNVKANRFNSVWNTRGWTFQEELFSRRRVVFENNTVSWQCGIAHWLEDAVELYNEPIPSSDSAYNMSQFMLSARFPDPHGLASLIRNYSGRQLTYPKDAHHAFAGALSYFSRCFKGGFLSGLPVLCFDAALLWQPEDQVFPRRTVGPRFEDLPSWSWVAWEGHMSSWSWLMANDFTKREHTGLIPGESHRIMPIIREFYGHKSKNSAKVLIRRELYDYRSRYANNKTSIVPAGWIRYDYDFDKDNDKHYWVFDDPKNQPKCFYKHVSDSTSEFWYPIPLNENESRVVRPELVSLISCRTRRAWLYAAERFDQIPLVALRNRNKIWAGALQVHQFPNASQDLDLSCNDIEGQALELVEIARGHAYEDAESPSVQELDYEGRPRRGTKYEFYHVLWVEWQDGIAYRKGLGRAEKDMWESEKPEWFDLTLG